MPTNITMTPIPGYLRSAEELFYVSAPVQDSPFDNKLAAYEKPYRYENDANHAAQVLIEKGERVRGVVRVTQEGARFLFQNEDRATNGDADINRLEFGTW